MKLSSLPPPSLITVATWQWPATFSISINFFMSAKLRLCKMPTSSKTTDLAGSVCRCSFCLSLIQWFKYRLATTSSTLTCCTRYGKFVTSRETSSSYKGRSSVLQSTTIHEQHVINVEQWYNNIFWRGVKVGIFLATILVNENDVYEPWMK